MTPIVQLGMRIFSATSTVSINDKLMETNKQTLWSLKQTHSNALKSIDLFNKTKSKTIQFNGF